MKRLLWKEWQERIWWVLPLLLVTVVMSALGFGFHPINASSTSEWLILMPALALLCGLAGYGSELKGERATFLYSRAISWKQVLAAKVLLGIIVALLATAAGAAASVLCCPAIYRSLITPASLGTELLQLGAATGIPYLAGLACSIVLPGLAGSVLVLLAGAGLVAGSIYTENALYQRNPNVFLQGAVYLLPVVLTVVIARFGLTLPLRERVTRAAAIMVGLLTVALLLDISPLSRRIQARWFPDRSYQQVSASPSGQFYYIQGSYNDTSGTRSNIRFVHQWMRVADGRRFPLPYRKDDPYYWRRWLDGDVLIVRPNPGVQRTAISVTRWTDGGPKTLSLLDWDENYPGDDIPIRVSPDRQRLVIVRGVYFMIFDLAANRATVYNWQTQTPVTDINKAPAAAFTELTACWWASNVVIAYRIPDTGEQRSLNLGTLSTLMASETTCD